MSITFKVAERLAVLLDVFERKSSFTFRVHIPNNVTSDRANELEADIKRVRNAAREVTNKWSNK